MNQVAHTILRVLYRLSFCIDLPGLMCRVVLAGKVVILLGRQLMAPYFGRPIVWPYLADLWYCFVLANHIVLP